MSSEKVRKKLIPVLKKLNLPTKIDFDAEKIIEVIKLDKKSAGDNITVIYSNEIGTFEMIKTDFNTLTNNLKEVKLG